MTQEEIIVNLIDSLPPTSYIEIGVLRGECICYIAKNSKKVTKCYGIDPYCEYQDFLHGGYIVGDASSKLNLYRCQENIKNTGVQDKVELILQDSHVAKDTFVDNSVGVVYIDKNFTYNMVVQDILDWWPKVKNGGYLTGHEWDSSQVKKAIIDTANNLGISEHLSGEHNVWKIKKVL